MGYIKITVDPIGGGGGAPVAPPGSATFVSSNGSGIAGCSWWGHSTWCGIGWGWISLGGAGARGGTRHTQHKPISIIINNKFIRPSAISLLGDFSLSKNGQPILAQPNFHTLYKVASAHPSMNYFQIFGVIIDETFSHPYIMKISRKCFTFFIWRNTFFFFRHLVVSNFLFYYSMINKTSEYLGLSQDLQLFYIIRGYNNYWHVLSVLIGGGGGITAGDWHSGRPAALSDLSVHHVT